MFQNVSIVFKCTSLQATPLYVLHQYGANSDQIVALFRVKPDLLKVPLPRWSELLNFLVVCTFTMDACVDIIAEAPTLLLDADVDRMQQTISVLRSCHFTVS